MTEECTEIELSDQPKHPILMKYKWQLRVSLYIIFVLTGQSVATLLGRLYYDKGGNSKWMATFIQVAGFPALLPLLFYFSTHDDSTNVPNDDFSETKPKHYILVFLYIAFGLIITVTVLMNSYGLLNLPLSTYSLIGATQLLFNAVFSYFLNAQKFTAFTINSIVLLTISVYLVAINGDSKDSMYHAREKHIIGFISTLAASATHALYHCLVQLCFEKVLKRETFSVVLDMQLYPSVISTCCCVVGLFVSGEWKALDKELKEYEDEKVSYVMTLVWIAVGWQISNIGLLGLIFEVSSLFSMVIDTIELPIIPILAAIFFHDKINGMKVIAFLLAAWGCLSYVYQQYLDKNKPRQIQGHHVTGTTY
ncbi:putative purine permease 10, partial [Mucuna pruriens]